MQAEYKCTNGKVRQRNEDTYNGGEKRDDEIAEEKNNGK